jgi:hypothetical protein
VNCRHCQSALTLPLIDLGSAPPSNALLTEQTLRQPEKWYPLRVLVCERCWLVQREDFNDLADSPPLFAADYPYFASCCQGSLAHAEQYVAAMTERFFLSPSSHSHVIEVGANDGYLLQYFLSRHIPCVGIEPTASTADLARQRGIPIIPDFLTSLLAKELAAKRIRADLLVCNNVLAHVPDINDFVQGIACLLKPGVGVATFEFPHLCQLISGCQFDTIYHEHFSYLSLTAVNRIFPANGLFIFDVEELPTHGGSLRVYAQCGLGKQSRSQRVDDLLARELAAGITTPAYYSDLQPRADWIKSDLLHWLLEAKDHGQVVAGYGAAAKGATLLNYAGIRADLLPFVCDITPAKQGKFLPGSRIPIYDESVIRKVQPDYVLILAWNWKQEIMQRLAYIRDWGGQFVTAVLGLEVE